MNIKTTSINVILLILLAISIPIAVIFGTVDISVTQFFQVLVQHIPGLKTVFSNTAIPPANIDAIVWQLRMPRVLLACITGAGLAIAGLILQSITRNNLADPHLLGISSGATLGAVIVTLYTGDFLGALTLPLAAFAGSLFATLVILLISINGKISSAAGLLMCGVSLSFVLMSAANFALFVGDNRASHQVIFWILGGLGLARWEYLLIPSIILTATISILFFYARYLNALLIGDDTASSLGINVLKIRLLFFILSALITSVLVAHTGAIGFIGLMIPHVGRYIVGSDITRLVSVVTILGALILLWVDVISRTMIKDQDLPVGIITGFLGGIFFIILMLKKTK